MGKALRAKKDLEAARQKEIVAQSLFDEDSKVSATGGAAVEAYANSLEKQITTQEAELAKMGDRLRHSTFNMYGRFTYMWTNDVKLAQAGKKEKTDQIDSLRSKLVEHNLLHETA